MHPAALAILVAMSLPVAAAALDQTPYAWSRVRIGGGGAIPTVVAHPGVPGAVYTTHDLCGPHAWDESSQTFHYLAGQWNWDSEQSRNLHGCECVAVDPGDTTGDTVFATLGGWATKSGHGLFISHDRGAHWQASTYQPITATDQFGARHHLGVDPLNGQIVYHANRMGGLYRSVDGGLNFAKTAAPNGDTTAWSDQKGESGGRMVVCDPNAGAVENPHRCRRVWYVVAGASQVRYLWLSEDGGETYHQVSSPPVVPKRIEALADGSTLLAGPSGLYRYRAGAWTGIGPAQRVRETSGLAVDPTDQRRIYLFENGSAQYSSDKHWWRTLDGGATWSDARPASSWTGAPPWYGTYNPTAMEPMPGSFTCDAAGRCWYSDWYVPWRCDNPWDANPVWRCRVTGIEETVVVGQGIASPRAGAAHLLVGVADDHGFVITDPRSFPGHSVDKLGVPGVNVTGIDWAERVPSLLVMTGQSGWNGTGNGGWSDDGGASFHGFASLPGGNGGRVAISADGTRIVWSYGASAYWSGDRGTSWHASNGPNCGCSQIFTYGVNLCSDRVAAQTFYGMGSQVMRSTDGGATWSVRGAAPGGDKLFANPLVEGELWCAGGYGLWRSRDGGATWTAISGISRSVGAGFGAGSTSGTVALYVVGTVAGTVGIFISDDLATTWRRIDDPANLPGNSPTNVVGDRQVYGRVYVATGGSGVYLGEPSQVPSTTPSVAVPAAGPSGAVTGHEAALSVLGASTAGEGTLTYTWTVISSPPGGHGSFIPNGTNAAKSTTLVVDRAGTWTVTALISGPAGSVSSGPVTVIVSQTLTGVRVSAPSTVAAGAAVDCQAQCLDQFGQPLATSPAVDWSATMGSMADGRFTAGPAAGPATISATVGAVSGQTTITIVAETTGQTASAASSGRRCGAGSALAFALALLVTRLRRNRYHC